MLRLRIELAGLALRLARTDRHEQLMFGQRSGDVAAQMIDRIFQRVIEQIADHRHPTHHPLPRPAELRMVKLGHRATAVVDRHHHVRYGVG